MVAEGRIGQFEEGNSHYIAEQKCKSQLMREGIVELMEIWTNESYSVLVKEQIQHRWGVDVHKKTGWMVR